MKFQAKIGGLRNVSDPAVITATTAVKHEYSDENRVTITVKGKELLFEACNGNIAVTSSSANIADLDFKPEENGSTTVLAKDFKAMLSGYKPDENMIVEVIGNELVITQESDQEQKSSMPIEPKAILMPSPSKSFNKELEINREMFAKSMDKVTFAVGIEKHRPQFLYWIIRVKHDGFRIAAGNGSRFAVYEIEGSGTIKAKGEFDIIISHDHDQVLSKLLGNSSADSIVIKESGTDAATAQTVVTFDSITMYLIGQDLEVKWPDEGKFLKRPNTIKHVTNLSDWDLALKSVQASNNPMLRQQSECHFCSMSFDSKKKVILVKSDHYMKTSRKVSPILDTVVTDNVNPDISFTCLADYIGDVYNHRDKANNNIQMEFVDSTAPIVIRYFAGDKVADAPLYKTDATKQTREQFTIFIAARSTSR